MILTGDAVALVDQSDVVRVDVDASRPVDVLPRDAQVRARGVPVAQGPVERQRSRVDRAVGAGLTRRALVGRIASVRLVDDPDAEAGTGTFQLDVAAVATILRQHFTRTSHVRVKHIILCIRSSRE